MKNVVALILGGGRGTRLYPLTLYRAKPAVPIGGKFRLIDIPISNCIHWDIKKIFVLTQFNSLSLHRHIASTYRFDAFSRGFVQILAAQQTMNNTDWYQGTADAVRQNIEYFRNAEADYVVVLSGDQLFRIDLDALIEEHRGRNAQITISSIAVEKEKAGALGILQCDGDGRIRAFIEKPRDEKILEPLRISAELMDGEGEEKPFLASMGLYVFNKEVLIDLLEADNKQDFGGEIIPAAIDTHRMYAHVFRGYWEDIGTVASFFEANLDFASPNPKFRFYDELRPIYTHARYLPGSSIRDCHIEESILSDGSRVEGCSIRNCVIGLRSAIGAGSSLERVVMMGADYYEREPAPPMGIGKNCRIRNAILDKNVRIGDNVTIDYQGGRSPSEQAPYMVVDGIVVIPKKVVIPSGTVIE